MEFQTEYLKCDVCPFWRMVDFDTEKNEEIYDCTVSTSEDADMVGDEMCCCHKYDDMENLDDLED